MWRVKRSGRLPETKRSRKPLAGPLDLIIKTWRSLMICRADSTSDPSCLDVFKGQLCVGHVFHRRGSWAAFRATGECIGQFATSREASAALGGRA